jgi:hypothetical protein
MSAITATVAAVPIATAAITISVLPAAAILGGRLAGRQSHRSGHGGHGGDGEHQTFHVFFS